jgi:hypothetical protein
MSHPEELKRLNAEISSHLGHLSKSFLYVLSLYVLGMVILRHCGQTQIATFLSGLVRCKFGTMKQRLREFTYESEQKRGVSRCSVDVQSCFAPMRGWVLSKFKGQHKQVVIALDATYLKNRFVILAVSVVVAGCAIPVAWHIQSGDQKGEWNPIWKRLITTLRGAIPADWTVFVLTDSGLYSKKLYYCLEQDFTGKVFMRILGTQGFFKPHGTSWIPLRQLVRRGMQPCILNGTCFKANPLICTLVLQWGDEYEQPCFTTIHILEKGL